MITSVISSSIAYLQTQQQRDGSFLSLSSSNPLSFQKALTFHSVFSTALILSCLNTLEETPMLKKMKQRAAAFLLAQKSTHWSFNYWVRGSKEAKEMPYPDDLDDTFCALSAIFQYDPKLIDGKALARVVTLLTSTEEKEGGPYRTWLVPENADPIWKDVDIAVNSNVAYLLSLIEIGLPNLTQFIESCIEENNLTSPYYPTIFPILYFISRFYRGNKMNTLKNILLSKRNSKGNWENPLHSALSISALFNFKITPDIVEKNILHLIHAQKNGSWQPYPFYTGVNPKRDRTYYAGSSSLTTGFCLEAIGKYLKALKTQSTKTTEIDTGSAHMQRQVVLHVQQRFSHLSKELRDQTESMLMVILKMDAKNQITLLPYFFRVALGKHGSFLSDELLISLGAANTYGWMAYTVYDNFLDAEGDPKTLSLANIALREVTTIFHTVVQKNLGFQKLFQKILDELDGANTWEVTHCRIPIANGTIDLRNVLIPHLRNYEKLAQKSLGHALGPLAILFLLGYTEKSPQVKNLLRFFTNYLIARQLNDDAHDWEKDLKRGHINPVCAKLLGIYLLKNKKNKRKVLLSLLIPKFQELFWYEVIADVCRLIRRHILLARRSLTALSIMENPVLFSDLLTSIEQSATQALEERKKTLAFIKSYGLSKVS